MSETPKDNQKDPWARFRSATRARIALGRSGDALPTSALLEFQLAHARARDAVLADWSIDALARAVGRPSVVVSSQAPDRQSYLQRPDLGRKLRPDHVARLRPGDADLAFVLADGLSSAAAMRRLTSA